MASINLGRVVGYSAYEVAVQNGFVGTEDEWLESLKGKDGDVAAIPFKGWFSASELLPPNPVVGDYAYVKGGTASDPAAIYECTTNGIWSNSGRTVDTSNVQTFASGEELNETKLLNEPNDFENSVVGGEIFKESNVDIIELDEFGIALGKAIKETGEYVNASTTGAKVCTYKIKNCCAIMASGVSPSQASGNSFCVFFDSNMNIVSFVHDVYSVNLTDYFIDLSNINAEFVKVFGNADNPPSVKGIYYNELEKVKLSQYKYNGVIPSTSDKAIIPGKSISEWLLKLREIESDVEIPDVVFGSANTGWWMSSTGLRFLDGTNSNIEFYRPCEIQIQNNYKKIVVLQVVSTSTGATGAGFGFLDENRNVIRGIRLDGDSSLTSPKLREYQVDVPQGAHYFVCNVQMGGTPPILNKDNFYIYAITTSGNIRDYIKEVVNTGLIEPYRCNNGNAINSQGVLTEAAAAGATVNEYNIKQGRYYVSGYSPSDGNAAGNVSFVVFDANGNVFMHRKPCRSSAFVDYVLDAPYGSSVIKVFGNDTQLPIVREYVNSFDNVKIDSIPQIFNYEKSPRVFSSERKLRILCFGSSWFMCTWWYLNKLIGNANIDCELHCYYIGHSSFDEWIALYNGSLEPFSGAESSRSAQKCVSTDGADWSISAYSSSGSYNAQSFRDDFYADITAKNWDVIAFQQGARQCIVDSEWDNADELVSIIKTNCNPFTKIAFNATYTFGINYPTTSGKYFTYISRTEDGKEYFQQMNNRNTKLFMAKSGVFDVAPNGAMLSIMRQDTELNVSNDMSSDGLHPDNGLPNLGLVSCFYETFIAPIIGVSIDDINWLPTTSTQKAVVSGNSFQNCSLSQFEKLKSHVKKALSNRFKYYRES